MQPFDVAQDEAWKASNAPTAVTATGLANHASACQTTDQSPLLNRPNQQLLNLSHQPLLNHHPSLLNLPQLPNLQTPLLNLKAEDHASENTP